MDANRELAVFLVGTFTAACITGLAGFAFGLVAAAIWLHVLTPAQATPLIVAYALIVQGYAVFAPVTEPQPPLHGLLRPALPQLPRAGRLADTGIGILNGIVGAATGLAGIAVVIWAGMRGWSRDEQRAMFQPVGVATFLMIALWLGGSGDVSLDIVRMFLIGLPALVVSTGLGWWLYGRMDKAAFRKVILGLLLISGCLLIVSIR